MFAHTIVGPYFNNQNRTTDDARKLTAARSTLATLTKKKGLKKGNKQEYKESHTMIEIT